MCDGGYRIAYFLAPDSYIQQVMKNVETKQMTGLTPGGHAAKPGLTGGEYDLAFLIRHDYINQDGELVQPALTTFPVDGISYQTRFDTGRKQGTTTSQGIIMDSDARQQPVGTIALVRDAMLPKEVFVDSIRAAAWGGPTGLRKPTGP